MWNRVVALAAFVSFAIVAPSAIYAEDPPDAGGADPIVSEPTPEAEKSLRWNAPEPSVTGFDWIRLKSGEWLKGEIMRMRDDRIRFDSDELDELDLDWADIRSFRSPRLHTYVFEGRRVLTGTASMQSGRIVVQVDGEELEFNRAKLVGIVSGDRSERSWWLGKLSLGALVRSGNTESSDLSARFSISREAPVTRLGLDYNGAVSSQDHVETENNHRATAALDIYVSRRFFVTVPSVGYYRDTFQNIENQITPGIGLGYDVVDRRFVDWEVGGGVGYQYTDFSATQTGKSTSSDGALLFSTSLDFDLTDDIEWDNDYELQLVVTNLGLTTQHLVSTLSVDLWKSLDLDVSFAWDRVQDPVSDVNGIVPASDDFRLSVGLGIEF